MALTLSPDQQHALNEILDFLTDPDEHEMSLGGSAGTGKTFLTSAILKQARKQAPMMQLLLNAKYELNVVLTSSTNKAAKVLSDATGEPASTIHKKLSLRVYNDFKTGKTILRRNPDSDIIKNTLVIIDEASMINKDLLKTIRDLTMNCKVLYIGDPYQLAPVFENVSPVFNDVKKCVYLNTIQRQAAGNPIIGFSQQFRNALDGNAFPAINTLGTEIQHVSGDEFQQQIDQAFNGMFDDNSARVIAWTNARVHQLNSYVRHTIGCSTDYKVGEHLLTNQPILDAKGRPVFNTDDIAEITDIKIGTKDGINGWLIQLNNTLQVFQAYNQAEVVAEIKAESVRNNEIKKVNKYNEHNNLPPTGYKPDWSRYFNLKEDFADLRPIFACTANKAQGSTYGTVFIDLNDIAKCKKNSDIIRMLYTAITRAQYKVVMTGSLPARLY